MAVTSRPAEQSESHKSYPIPGPLTCPGRPTSYARQHNPRRRRHDSVPPIPRISLLRKARRRLALLIYPEWRLDNGIKVMQLSEKDKPKVQIEPSLCLYQVVIGAMRAQGTTLSRWCDLNDIHRENARAALHGLWRGEKANKTIDVIIDGADREIVLYLLKKRNGTAA